MNTVIVRRSDVERQMDSLALAARTPRQNDLHGVEKGKFEFGAAVLSNLSVTFAETHDLPESPEEKFNLMLGRFTGYSDGWKVDMAERGDRGAIVETVKAIARLAGIEIEMRHSPSAIWIEVKR